MSTKISQNTVDLQALLQVANSLPDAGSGGGGGTDQSASILDKSATELSNSQVKLLGTYVLRECDKLVSVDFPAVEELESYVFYNCTALKNVSLPAAQKLASYSFRGCTALEVLDFPTLTSIATNAFYGCSKLKTLILRSSTMCSLSGTNAFANTPMASGGTATGCKIYSPSALIATYQANANWSALNCDFVAIEGSPYA